MTLIVGHRYSSFNAPGSLIITVFYLLINLLLYSIWNLRQHSGSQEKKNLSYKAFQISTWISVQCTCVASSVPGVLINNDQSRTGAFNRTRPHMAWSFHTTPHRPRTTSAAQAPGGHGCTWIPTKTQEQENRNELKHYSELHLLLSFYFILFFLCFDGGDVKTKAETTAAFRSVSRGWAKCVVYVDMSAKRGRVRVYTGLMCK